MRIAYLCSDTDVPVVGPEGCSVHIQSMVRALSGLGHHVSLTCANAGGAASRILGNVPVREVLPHGLDAKAWDLVEQEPLVQNNRLERDLRSVFYNVIFARQASSLFKAAPPDLLYERYALFGWAGVELSREFRIPLVLEVNAPLCREQEGYDRFTLMATAREMDRHIFAGATLIVTVSRWLKDWIVSLGIDPAKVHVIPNGVSPEMLDPNVSSESVRERHALEGHRVIGYVGSFQDWHDVGGLLRAFAQARGTRPDLRLLLVGNGPRRRAMEALARQLGVEDAVVFTGQVPHDHMASYVAAMDIAVVPYGNRPDFYFSPMKLFESMAMARPTVAASLGQIAEVIEHRKNGWLYEPGNLESLTAALETLLDDPQLARDIGSAARRQVLKSYTWEAVARQVLERVEAIKTA